MTLVTNSLKKVALVTGANRGLGFEVALELAQRKFKVVMADKVELTPSKEHVICLSGNTDVHEYRLDLASFNSVKCFAENVTKDLDYIDVLVNNAGVFCMKRQKTEDCLDAVMQINHLSPFLLTYLLTDLLKKSKNGRIIYVTSNGAFFNRLTLEQLSKPDYFTPHFISGAIHYYNTKLCNMISTKYFTKKLKQFNITCNSVHPHMMNTEFLISNKHTSLLSNLESRISTRLIPFVTRDVKYCADGVIFLATSNTIHNVTGKYFINSQVHREPSAVEDKKFCHEICNESEKLVGIKK
ncbi:unnamed protein product [Psylliodes chrysocephalus]|uniref:Uncharacterized protein n=1 Tax=Psylliodes chrysocephalus TaxID=3402493 RepID=A0A9P0CVV9_9CUCU|nr:unnamed protein product [Psylliodes chrysocephala]